MFLVYVCLLARLLGAQFEIIKKSWVQRFHKFFIIFFNSRRRVPFPVLLLLPLVMNEVSENWRKTSHPTCNIDVCAQATKTIWPWISQTTLLSSLLKKASLLPTYIKKSVKSTQTRYGVKYFGRIMSFSDGKKILPITPYTLYYTHLKNAALIHDLKNSRFSDQKKIRSDVDIILCTPLLNNTISSFSINAIHNNNNSKWYPSSRVRIPTFTVMNLQYKLVIFTSRKR